MLTHFLLETLTKSVPCLGGWHTTQVLHPSFWHQKIWYQNAWHTSKVTGSPTSFWYQKLGRRTRVVCRPP